MATHKVVLSPREEEFLQTICKEKELDSDRVFRLCLALYQLYDRGVIEFKPGLNKLAICHDYINLINGEFD